MPLERDMKNPVRALEARQGALMVGSKVVTSIAPAGRAVEVEEVEEAVKAVVG